jgi:hypothetical protein|tara:strand:- start:2907 stop:3182 length:276 start_codon:yes stop_codon:yes gene_type:complete
VAKKTLNPIAPSPRVNGYAYLEIAVPVNQINVSPDGKFINLPWGAKGTFTHGTKQVEATIGKAGKVVILTKEARKQSTKVEKPAVDLAKLL